MSEEEINERRYTLTWLLEDLKGVSDPVEVLLMAGSVTHCAASLLLNYHRRWLGQGMARGRKPILKWHGCCPTCTGSPSAPKRALPNPRDMP